MKLKDTGLLYYIIGSFCQATCCNFPCSKVCSEVKKIGKRIGEIDLGKWLWEADLRRAKNCKPQYLLPDIYSLKLMPSTTKITFWKYLTNGKSPYQNSGYKVGKTYTEKDIDKDETNLCGKGLNVATLMWCLKDDLEANEFLEVEFKVKDIVAIPYMTDGKFRVKRFKVLRKITRKQAINLLKKSKEK